MNDHANEPLIVATLCDATADRFRLLVESVQDYGIFMLDPPGNIFSWNPGAEKSNGYTSEEIIGRHVSCLYTDEDVAAGKPLLGMQIALEEGRFEERAIRLRKGGVPYWAIVTLTKIQSSTGQHLGFANVTRDITAWQKAEDLLRERAALAALSADVGLAFTKRGTLRETLGACATSMVANLEAAFARIWTLNEGEKVLELQASAGVYTHLDGPHSRVPVGKFKIGLIAEERKPHLTNDVAHDPRVSDQEWARREGMVAFAGYPLLLDDRLVGVMAVFSRAQLSNTTLGTMSSVASTIALGIERKRGEETLRHAEARKAAILEASPDAIVSMDHMGRILGFSPAAERIFGFSQAEALGQYLAELIVPPALRRRHQDGLAAYVAGGPSTILNRRVEVPALRKDGNEFTAELTITRIRSDGMPIFTAFVRDITARRRREESLKLFRALIDHSNDAIEVIDPTTGRFLDINDNCCESLGYVREELLQLGVADIDPMLARRGWAEAEDKLRRTGSLVVESQHRRKDGSVFPVEVNAKLVQMDRDYVVAVVRDVTDRKRIEQRLLAQHAVTKILAESPSLPDASSQILQALCDGLEWELGGLWRVDRPAQVLRCLRIWHRPAESFAEFAAGRMQAPLPLGIGLPGRVWADRAAAWVPDMGTDASFPRAPLALQDGLHGAFGFPIIFDGEVLGVLEFFSTKVRPRDEDSLKTMTAVASQIGQFIERKQAEELLRKSNQNLRTLIEAAPLAIVAIDLQGIVQAWNPAAEKMFGWTTEEVLGRVLPNIPPETKAEFQTLLEEQQDGKGRAIIGLETVRMRKDGTRLDIRMSAAPLHDVGGKVVGLLGLIADITKQKVLEEQFRQAQKMEAFGQLAGGVAHDFNNMLTIINGYSSLLLDGLQANDPSRDMLSEILKAGERSASLTSQLLAFSRRQVLTLRVLDLNEVVAATDKMLRRLIGEDVRLVTSLKSALCTVRADPGQVEQILMNLAVNARDAMPRGGQLTIETENVDLDAEYVRGHPDARPGPQVLLSVADTGTGMSMEVIAKVFEPFFTTKETGKGTGLGLATVFGIVKQSGGHVTVSSEVGVGTTFKVYLPCADVSSTSPEGKPESRSLPRGTETVLLVEDEEAVRSLTRSVLVGCGYRVVEAANGEEASRLAAKHNGPIHLLVTDVVMPGVGGRIVAEQVAESHPEAQVLFVSGYMDDAVIRHGVLREGVNFLQKPYSPNALATKVRNVLDAL